jgi:hypothetical protein
MIPHPSVQNWIAVASAGHVRRGRAAGFMQVRHGKTAPLRRIQRQRETRAGFAY